MQLSSKSAFESKPDCSSSLRQRSKRTVIVVASEIRNPEQRRKVRVFPLRRRVSRAGLIVIEVGPYVLLGAQEVAVGTREDEEGHRLGFARLQASKPALMPAVIP